MNLKILLADDEPSLRLTAGDALESQGHKVTLACDGLEAKTLLATNEFDLLITDIRMPKITGLELFDHLRQHRPETDAILVTAYGEIRDAVKALKNGALDYLIKPFDMEELVLRVLRIAERRTLQIDLDDAKEKLKEIPTGLSELIGESPPMIRLKKRISTIANSDASVLITGESGTGKELIAKQLHKLSSRADQPFIAVNCAGLPESLLEAELFGHERGAFTGALHRRIGKFEAANNGTIFLDEVGEIPLNAQVKLLRVLQEGVIEPIGSNKKTPLNIWVLSATNRNLRDLISSGSFREDLYYRLMVLDVLAPPLRDRRGDLPLLARYFLEYFSKDKKKIPEISPQAWAAISAYPFPGNVRELEHAIQHGIVLCGDGPIEISHLPADIVGLCNGEQIAPATQKLADAAREFERQYLLQALGATGGKKTKTADLLGISRKNLWEKLRNHEITDSDLDTD